MNIDLNSDMGEGFGPWKMGDDEAMLGIVTSANVACGWHAGDPNIMFRTAERAKANGVAIGAHPGFNDLWGFGRRVIRGDSTADIERMIAYQIGALQAVAALAGHRVTYVKAHGALNTMANEDEDLALAIARGIKGVDRSLANVCMPGLAMERMSEKTGLRVAREIYADRTYDDSGNLTSRKTPGSVLPRRKDRFGARPAHDRGPRHHDRDGQAHPRRHRHDLRSRRRADRCRDGAHRARGAGGERGDAGALRAGLNWVRLLRGPCWPFERCRVG